MKKAARGPLFSFRDALPSGVAVRLVRVRRAGLGLGLSLDFGGGDRSGFGFNTRGQRCLVAGRVLLAGDADDL